MLSEIAAIGTAFYESFQLFRKGDSKAKYLRDKKSFSAKIIGIACLPIGLFSTFFMMTGYGLIIYGYYRDYQYEQKHLTGNSYRSLEP